MYELTIDEVNSVHGAWKCDPDGGDVLILFGLSVITGLSFAAGPLAGSAAALSLISHGKNMYDKGEACKQAR